MSGVLDEDLLINILLRVSTKSLLKFNCVSKAWKSFISNPEFVQKHIHQSYLSRPFNTPQRLLFKHNRRNKEEIYSVHKNNETFDVIKDIKINFPFDGIHSNQFTVIDSCNGLLCLCDYFRVGYDQPVSIILWNTLLRKKLTLPQPSEHSSLWCTYGFGYDKINKDFKVVNVFYHEIYSSPVVQIFSLNKGTWKEIRSDLDIKSNTNLPPSRTFLAFVENRMHWLSHTRVDRGVKCSNKLIAFDINSEVFEEIPLPDSLVNGIYIMCIVYEEKLVIIEKQTPKKKTIWIMEEYGLKESWKKLVDIDCVANVNWIFPTRVMLCKINNSKDNTNKGNQEWRTEDKDGDKAVLLSPALYGNVILYNQRTLEISRIGIRADIWFFSCPYTESLGLLLEGDQAFPRFKFWSWSWGFIHLMHEVIKKLFKI